MKGLGIALTAAGLAMLFFVWCCCKFSGIADDTEENDLDADWYPEEMYDGDDA